MAEREAAGSDVPGVGKARSWLAVGPKRLLIGGMWVEARSGQRFVTIDPATEETLTEVARADAIDVDDAVIAARRAFEHPSWAAMSPHDRTRLLLWIGVEKGPR